MISISESKRPLFTHIFNGEHLLKGSDPIAILYFGHQFGHYNPQLGDGRAISLGEINHWEIQLKGTGITPYSHQKDGQPVYRSTIREYFYAKAMHGLGIPTTRSLYMLGSPKEVYREQIKSGAILVCMASSFIRFGNFEVFFHRKQHYAGHPPDWAKKISISCSF